MLLDSPFWNQVMILIGEITVILVAGLLVAALILVIIALYSIRSGKLYFPQLLRPAFFFLEGIVKAICRLLGVPDRDLLAFSIRLRNSMNTKTFEAIPVEKRAVFLPQCLRSAKCPASLTPEGLKCQQCGQCPTGRSVKYLESLGYRVFIVPGSSFIKRMVKKYRPEGIIGVGCIIEVKEGLEMCDELGIAGIGVVNLKDGCVETIAPWSEIFDVARSGLPGDSAARNGDLPA